MTQIEAQQLVKEQDILVDGKPAKFVALHSDNHTPGRYSTRAIVRRYEAGRDREVSVRLATITLPEVSR